MDLYDRTLGVLGMMVGTAVVLTAGVVGATRIADRRQARQTEPADPIDLASDASFPASDPPSFTGTTAAVRP